MSDHVLGYVNGYMTASIVHSYRVANHLREDGARSAPRTDYLLLATFVHGFYLFQQFRVGERPFL
jgi:hypothetical protein